jgi:hypothetical protein
VLCDRAGDSEQLSGDVLSYMASHPNVAKFAVPDDCVVVQVSSQSLAPMGAVYTDKANACLECCCCCCCCCFSLSPACRNVQLAASFVFCYDCTLQQLHAGRHSQPL